MKLSKVRLFLVAGALGAFASGIVVRLFVVQVLRGSQYSAESRRQSQQRVILRARRGRILDRKGRVLACNMDSKLDVDMRTLQAGSSSAREESEVAEIIRVYPHGDLASSVLGYIGRDGYGLGGAELAFDRALRGEDGWAIVRRDATTVNGRQNRYRTADLPYKKPTTGADVYLTIDVDIQKITQSVLKQTVVKHGAKGALAMVMDPHTGTILAMANEPCFDPNVPARFPLARRRNRCVGQIYEPGSTFKVVTAAAALEEGIVTEKRVLSGNNGVFEIYDQSIRDHKPYGNLTFAEALAHSSNVCFAKVASELSNHKLHTYSRNFGFGARTGLPLPGEEAGIVNPVRQWSGRTRVTMAIGQEISVTLQQMMLVFGSIANGGVLLEPRIHEKTLDGSGNLVSQTTDTPVRRVISKATARRMRRMLKGVVEDGTGTRAGVAGASVAGKTGTSQKLEKETGTYSDSLYYSSFIGFVPAENPVLLCGVVVDEPAGGLSGGLVAAPAFRRIVRRIISHPDLDYAERILGTQPPDTATLEVQVVSVPSLVGMPAERARDLLEQEKINFEVVGSGDSVTHQTPRGGAVLAEKTSVTLYAYGGKQAVGEGGEPSTLSVPDCRGKDLRDALNILNVKGLVPYVDGAGRVREQKPAVGVPVRHAEACTLICSFEG